MPLQSVYYELSDPGLTPLSGLTEIYIPLWVHSGAAVSCTGTAARMVLKATTSSTSSPDATNTSAKLHTLNQNWATTQKFALEIAFSVNTSGQTAYANLVEIDGTTSGKPVTNSQFSTTSTTFTVARSSAFTLTPGKSYCISLWSTTSTSAALFSKAHLVALMQ